MNHPSCARLPLLAVVLAATLLEGTPAQAKLLCASNQSGIVRLREACKRGESALPVSIEDGGRTVRITGANVQIVNGTGETAAAPNGVGNLILGYDEPADPPRERGGSHNLVVGPGHGYSSVGGIVAGEGNTVSAPYAAVTGGRNNAAGAEAASICGGQGNAATGIASSVAGGGANAASGLASAVSGGSNNDATASFASVGGGWLNVARGSYAAIGGGGLNEAVGTRATVSGGFGNAASGTNATVGGGFAVGAPRDGDWAAGGLYQPGS